MTTKTMGQFIKFHKSNPHVYELFKKFTGEVIRVGHTRMSSDMICHRIRWEAAVNTKGAGWNTATGKPLKINNNHSPFYARLFIYEYPQYKDIFNFRAMKT